MQKTTRVPRITRAPDEGIVPFVVQLPVQDRADVRDLAQRVGLNQSEFIRRAIREAVQAAKAQLVEQAA